MEQRMNKTSLLTVEAAAVQTQEQGIELDHVLPDYFPDVHRIIRCTITPSAAVSGISGCRLSYELRAEIRVLYCSEGSTLLQCMTQTMLYNRIAELPEEGMTVQLSASVDYSNCRAVSSRRLDVRGAVTIQIQAATVRQQEALSDISGNGIQIKQLPVEYPSLCRNVSRRILLAEELELNSAQPAVLHLLRVQATPVAQTSRYVSGKLQAEGELQVKLLYACQRDGEGDAEPMEFRIPYSQILEPESLTEEDICCLRTDVVSCEVKPVTDANGEIRLLRCEAELQVSCQAVRMCSGTIVEDAFSTRFASRLTMAEIRTGGRPFPVQKKYPVTMQLHGENTGRVCDVWCEVKHSSAIPESGGFRITGMLCAFALVRQEGMPVVLEQEEPFSFLCEAEDICKEDTLHYCITAEHCSYTLGEKGEIALKAELTLDGCLRRNRICRAVAHMEITEDAPIQQEYALKLYFGKAKESIWEIAKRCAAGVDAIMEENDLTGEQLPADAMLLIPMVR